MNRSEKHMRDMLEAEGFCVKRLNKAKRRRADFFVQDEKDQYFIEVTERSDSKFLSDLSCRAELQGVACDSREISEKKYSNQIDGIIKDKSDQLNQTDDSQGKFHIIWIASFGQDVEFLFEQIRRALYGLALLWVKQSGPSFENRLCYFYNNFTFYKTPVLDAVIFSTQKCGCLFVNSFSDNAERFRKSKMYSLFGNECVDPFTLQKNPKILFVSRDIDRAKPGAQCKYLKETFGVMTSVGVESQFKGLVSLSDIVDNEPI